MFKAPPDRLILRRKSQMGVRGRGGVLAWGCPPAPTRQAWVVNRDRPATRHAGPQGCGSSGWVDRPSGLPDFSYVVVSLGLAPYALEPDRRLDLCEFK